MRIPRHSLPTFFLLCAIALAAVCFWCWRGLESESAGPVSSAGPVVHQSSEVVHAPAAPGPSEISERAEIVAKVAVPEPQPEPAAVPLPEEPALAMRQDLRWQAAMPESGQASFREWTRRFEKATPAQQTALLAEGRRLVEERRQEMSALIDKNPRRALELAVPVAVRRKLPAEIAARLEEPVSGRGDLWVAAAIPMPGQELRVRAIQRRVQMSDGRVFEAYTYGLRENLPTRANLPIQGVALDGKLALSELP